MNDPADKRKITGKIQKMEMNHFSKQYCFIKPSNNIKRTLTLINMLQKKTFEESFACGRKLDIALLSVGLCCLRVPKMIRLN